MALIEVIQKFKQEISDNGFHRAKVQLDLCALAQPTIGIVVGGSSWHRDEEAHSCVS